VGSCLGVSRVGSSSSKVFRSADAVRPRSVFEFGEPSSTKEVTDSGVKLGSTSDLVFSPVVSPRQCCEVSNQAGGCVEDLPVVVVPLFMAEQGVQTSSSQTSSALKGSCSGFVQVGSLLPVLSELSGGAS
jgi:hypothetical protein